MWAEDAGQKRAAGNYPAAWASTPGALSLLLSCTLALAGTECRGRPLLPPWKLSESRDLNLLTLVGRPGHCGVLMAPREKTKPSTCSRLTVMSSQPVISCPRSQREAVPWQRGTPEMVRVA